MIRWRDFHWGHLRCAWALSVADRISGLVPCFFPSLLCPSSLQLPGWAVTGLWKVKTALLPPRSQCGPSFCFFNFGDTLKREWFFPRCRWNAGSSWGAWEPLRCLWHLAVNPPALRDSLQSPCQKWFQNCVIQSDRVLSLEHYLVPVVVSQEIFTFLWP